VSVDGRSKPAKGYWAEKVLERWVLGPFTLVQWGAAALRVYDHDWPTAGILAVSAVLTGIVGARLSQNRDRSAAELRRGNLPLTEQVPLDGLLEEESFGLVKSSFNLASVVALTAAALGIRYHLVWWKIIAAAVGIWVAVPILVALLILFLIGVANFRARRRGDDS